MGFSSLRLLRSQESDVNLSDLLIGLSEHGRELLKTLDVPIDHHVEVILEDLTNKLITKFLLYNFIYLTLIFNFFIIFV
jgi:hypothetical protein